MSKMIQVILFFSSTVLASEIEIRLPQENIDITISTNKSEYILYEPIIITYEFLNWNTFAVSQCHGFSYKNIILIDSNGNIYRKLKNYSTCSPPHLYRTGYSYYTIQFDFVPKGTYKVLFEGIDNLEEIPINVDIPEGENFEAYKHYKRALELEAKNEVYLSAIELNKIVLKYRDSLYACLARKRLEK